MEVLDLSDSYILEGGSNVPDEAVLEVFAIAALQCKLVIVNNGATHVVVTDEILGKVELSAVPLPPETAPRRWQPCTRYRLR